MQPVTYCCGWHPFQSLLHRHISYCMSKSCQGSGCNKSDLRGALSSRVPAISGRTSAASASSPSRGSANRSVVAGNISGASSASCDAVFALHFCANATARSSRGKRSQQTCMHARTARWKDDEALGYVSMANMSPAASFQKGCGRPAPSGRISCRTTGTPGPARPQMHMKAACGCCAVAASAAALL